MKKLIFFAAGASLLLLASCDKYSATDLDTVKTRWIQYDDSTSQSLVSPYLTDNYVDAYWSFNSLSYAADTTMLVIENPMNIPFSVNYASYPAPYGDEGNLYNSSMNWYSTSWVQLDRQHLSNNGDTVIVVLDPGPAFNIGDTRTIHFDVKWDTKLIRQISYKFTREY